MQQASYFAPLLLQDALFCNRLRTSPLNPRWLKLECWSSHLGAGIHAFHSSQLHEKARHRRSFWVEKLLHPIRQASVPVFCITATPHPQKRFNLTLVLLSSLSYPLLPDTLNNAHAQSTTYCLTDKTEALPTRSTNEELHITKSRPCHETQIHRL